MGFTSEVSRAVRLMAFLVAALVPSLGLADWESDYPQHRRAFESGDLKAVKRILEKDRREPEGRQLYRLDTRDTGSPLMTALVYAVSSGNIALIKYLEGVGWLDTCRKLGDSCDVIRWAATHGHLHLIKYFISQGFDVFKYGGTSALHQAAVMGHFETLKFLCEKGIDNNVKDYYGRTTLYYAKAMIGVRSSDPREDARMRKNIPRIVEYLTNRDCTKNLPSKR